MARSVPRPPIPPLPPPNIWRTFVLWQMPHGGTSLRVQMPHGGDSEGMQVTNLWNKKTIIPHKLIYFYRICNSRSLTAKTGTFSRIMHVRLSVISRSKVETIVQICAHVGVEPYATFKVRADLLWQRPHRGEEEVRNSRQMPGWDGRS